MDGEGEVVFYGKSSPCIFFFLIDLFLATIEDFNSFFPFILCLFSPFPSLLPRHMPSPTISHQEHNTTSTLVDGNNFRVQTTHR